METALPRKVWTRQESYALIGVIPGAERLELIEGDLIVRMEKKPLHTFWLRLVNEWLREMFGWRHVRAEQPIRLIGPDGETSEPEPDLAVTSAAMQEAESVPDAATVRLIIEIAHSTLDMDLKIKSRLYARSQISDYWVIDAEKQRIFVHREPLDGHYRRVDIYAAGELIHPLANPELAFQLSALPELYLTN